MADDKLPAAIREAEEWLTRYDGAVHAIPPGSADPPEVRLLRSLLAALTAEGEAKATVGRAVYAPGGEGKTCPGCGGLGWIPAGDEQLGCIDCNGTGHDSAPPPPPAQDAVREAAALTVYCDVCQADRRQPCHSTTTGEEAPYPHPERVVAALAAAKGGE